MRSSTMTSRRFAAPGILCATVIAAGCASTPDVTLSYRLAQWELAIAVVHTITCAPGTPTKPATMIVDRSATAVPVFRARTDGASETLKLRALDTVFADSELKMEFTDDGRLKSINQSTTGQGEPVLKAAISAAGALSASMAPLVVVAKDVELRGAGNSRFEGKTAPSAAAICAIIEGAVPPTPNRPLTASITRTAVVSEKEIAPPLKVMSGYQETLSNELSKAGLPLGGEFTLVASPDLANRNLQPLVLAAGADQGDSVALRLQQIKAWTLKVSDGSGELLKRDLALPTQQTFAVPIPKSALFGKQGFSLALADSGRIVSIGYTRGQGVTSALGALGAAAGAETSFDTAEAAALKAAADLVAAHQRAARCALTPEKC